MRWHTGIWGGVWGVLLYSSVALGMEAETPSPPFGIHLPSTPEVTQRRRAEWLNRHVETSFQVLVPVQFYLETNTSGRGVWTQPALGATLGGRALDHLFMRLTLWGYPDAENRASWTPDFTYSFGWDDWRPWRPFLVHASYSGNRFPWNKLESQPLLQLQKGVNSAGFRLELPKTVRDGLRFPAPLWLGGTVAAHYVPQYDVFRTSDLPYGTGYHMVATAFTVALTWQEHWFAHFTAYYYPFSNQQQPWDPDFTYSFGYMDWQPWRLTVRWNNYAGNRWWFNERPGMGGIDTGALVVSLRLGF